MALKPETKLKHRVLASLRELPNTWFVKCQQVSINGTPDILACIAGIFVGIELKMNAKKLDRLQVYNLSRIADAGGVAIILTPLNLDEVMIMLEKLSKQDRQFINNKVGFS